MVLLLAVSCVHASDGPTVGYAVRLRDLELPGTELEVKPMTDRKSPIALRIVRAEPVAKGYRYELEYVGLEPGTFDLRDYLLRKDGSPTKDLPPLRVTVTSVLPAGQILPHDLESLTTPRPGGYRLALLVGAILWSLGLLAILLVGRRRRKAALAAARPQSLADHLRPLVEDAVAGRAQPTRLADLERALISYWSRRLHVRQQRPIEALTTLRQHAQAGPLLVQLESWLHRPTPAEKIDVAHLLEPYRHLPPDALDAETHP